MLELRGRNAKEGAPPHNRESVVTITKNWVHRCDENHERCRGNEPRPLPMRLVDIGGPKLRLIESKPGQRGLYVALSYSWGDSSGVHNQGGTKYSMLQLREKTRSTLLREINHSKLSKAHQHGIHVARELGYRYIWIDALCIIQDNQDDWKEQPKFVPEIYGGADLTIVAGRSDDSRRGFLEPMYESSHCAQVPYRSIERPDLKTCWIGLPRHRRTGPTSDRGSCYQEALMSRRMIIYGEQQLSFRCRERHDFEDGHFEFVGASNDWFHLGFQNSDDKGDKTLAESAEIMAGRGTPIHKAYKPEALTRRLLSPWYRITSEYSCLSFFDPTDNHAALSGLVFQFQKAFDKRFGPGSSGYMAGLWERDMPGALLWRSRRIVDPDLPALQYPIQNGVAVYRAPSWSWMALKGPVYHNIGEGRGLSGVQLPWRTPRLRPANPDGRTWCPDPNGWGPLVIHGKDFPTEFRLEVKAWIRKVRVSQFQTKDYPDWDPWFRAYEKCKQSMNKHTILLEAEENKPLKTKSQDQKMDREASWEIAAIGLFDLKYGAGCAPSTMYVMCVTSDEGLLLEQTVDPKDGSVLFRRLGVFLVEGLGTFYPKGVAPQGRDAVRVELLPSETIVLI
ncbi:MAG: hypothetical protein M1833_003508 [Piccolia ochrophora]|nr:MAG: hypothetical protein M1833_003508 [Piccolia ochrophora]